ncbi:DUF397 domain-containing protein [Streptomyces syringium]|uniref:DUF397 domain-containing protein n=1 Tax=Streptomyces syringium TaxID=76729 RepID=A0ABS4Y7Z7_9ACTN|nr:DUF397 domain-containing protein [Streptomyces syringium]MBP2404919.1 hypothetical protein [Streptomyces syringium]
MGIDDGSGTTWIKSSHSNGQSACLEVCFLAGGRSLPVRDSKNPHGPTLLFEAAAWSAFIASLKGGSIPAG